MILFLYIRLFRFVFIFLYYNMSTRISIRVPNDMKKSMANVNINWSSYLREAIDRKVREHRMERIGRRMDKTREKTVGKGGNMAEEIFKWRKRH